MTDITDTTIDTAIGDDEEYEVAELICLGCTKRWIGVYHSKTLLKDMECKCGRIGSIIKTGQTLDD